MTPSYGCWSLLHCESGAAIPSCLICSTKNDHSKNEIRARYPTGEYYNYYLHPSILKCWQLNIMLEVMLGLDSSSNAVSREESGNSRTLRRSEGPINKLNRIAKIFERVTFTILSVTVSMLVPDF